jgi:hypothetical protein
MRLLFLILLLAATTVIAADPGPTTFEVYPIAFADLRATEQVAKSIAGPDGTVVLDEQGQRLLVATTKEKHAQLAEMIGKLNIIPRNVRIDVEFRERSDDSQTEVSVTADGEVTRVDGVTSSKIRIKPRIIDENTRGSSRTRQTLLVASGREGVLHIGDRVPYIEWLTSYGARSGYLQQSVQWQDVGSRLVVSPSVVGDGPLIRIRLTPELSGRVDGQPLQTRFSGAATEVVVSDGETFQLGGLDQNRDMYSRFLVGVSEAGSQQTLDIFLTPHIMDPKVPVPHPKGSP